MTAPSLDGQTLLTRARVALQGVPRDTWLALGVLVAGIFLRLNNLGLPVDNYDEGVYVSSLRSLATGHTLYAQVYCGQPPLFLLLLLPWYRLFGLTLAAARLGVVAYSLIGQGAMWWLGWQLGGRRVGLIALTLLAFDPLYLAQSRSVQAEAPALAFSILAVALAAHARRKPDLRYAALCGVALGVGFMIKLFVVPAIIPIGAFLLAPMWHDLVAESLAQRQWPTRARLNEPLRASWPTVAASVGAFLAVVLLAFFSQPDRGAEWAQVIGLHAHATGALANQRGNNLHLFLGIWWEIPLCAAGTLAGIWGWQRGQWTATVIALWGAACIIVLALQTPLFDHHLALLPPAFIPGAALLPGLIVPHPHPAPTPPQRRGSAPRIARASVRSLQPGRAVLFAPRDKSPRGPFLARLSLPHIVSGWLALLLLIAFGKSLGQEIAAQRSLPTGLLQAASGVQFYTLPDDQIVTDDQTIAVFANREVPAALVDTSTVRITSGALTTQQVIAAASNPRVVAILWYSGRFALLPGLKTWVQRHFVLAIDYGSGRGLYLRTPSGPPAG
jgi:4-amino-4-deoxy-L-arabinose transferase-like glycosyltransferase